MKQYFISKLKIICSTIFLCLYFNQNVQAEEQQKIQTNYSIKPSALNLGIDFLTPIWSYCKYGTSFHSYGIHSSIDFNRIFIDVDYNFVKSSMRLEIYDRLPEDYRNNGSVQPFNDASVGSHFKIGFSYNFLNKNKNHNAVFAGIGYNCAIFKYLVGENLCLKSKAEFETQEILQIGKCWYNTHWMDVLFGLRLSITKHIYVGHSVCINFLRTQIKNDDSNIIPYMIPGWGKEEDTSTVNFSTFLGFNFPLYDDPKFITKE